MLLAGVVVASASVEGGGDAATAAMVGDRGDDNDELSGCLACVKGAADAGSSTDISPGETDGLLPVSRLALPPSLVFALAGVNLAGDQRGELGANGERAPDGLWEVPMTRPRLGLW